MAAKRDQVTKSKAEPDWHKVDESRAIIKNEEVNLAARTKKLPEQVESQRRADAQPNQNLEAK
ncbi:MAG: hypothetical protein M1823_004351 [Watsoniomyces obsoletus]|nr:MAG: hypothetical protein M1823_004351 [Watsoniomyces obsoletus]